MSISERDIIAAQQQTKDIADVLNRHVRVYIIGYSNSSEAPTYTLVDFNDTNNDIGPYISEVARGLDFRLTRMNNRIQVDSHAMPPGRLKPRYYSGKSRGTIINALKADLDVFSGSSMKPIILERNDEGTIVGHKIAYQL